MALVLLVLAGGLAAILTHDGVPVKGSALDAAPGQPTSLTGDLQPFTPPRATVQRWAPVTGVLANHTYVLEGTPSDWLVLVTSDHPLPTGDDVLVRGDVLLRTHHPDQPWRTLLVLRADGVDAPLLG